MRIATVDQVAAIANRVPPRYRALVLVAASGGLRWGELAGLCASASTWSAARSRA
jgi:integrase